MNDRQKQLIEETRRQLEEAKSYELRDDPRFNNQFAILTLEIRLNAFLEITKLYNDDTIGRIDKLLKLKKMTQLQLAEKSGIHASNISHWFKGTPIRTSNLKIIAEILECDLDYLTCKQDEIKKEVL